MPAIICVLALIAAGVYSWRRRRRGALLATGLAMSDGLDHDRNLDGLARGKSAGALVEVIETVESVPHKTPVISPVRGIRSALQRRGLAPKRAIVMPTGASSAKTPGVAGCAMSAKTCRISHRGSVSEGRSYKHGRRRMASVAPLATADGETDPALAPEDPEHLSVRLRQASTKSMKAFRTAVMAGGDSTGKGLVPWGVESSDHRRSNSSRTMQRLRDASKGRKTFIERITSKLTRQRSLSEDELVRAAEAEARKARLEAEAAVSDPMALRLEIKDGVRSGSVFAAENPMLRFARVRL